MSNRYNFQNFKSAVKNPRKFGKEFERLLSKQIFESVHGSGIDVMRKDWDNLIILDACRYDYFSEYCDMDGSYDTVTSKGNNSKSFIQGNFEDRSLHDTIYVTANPFVECIDNNVFHKVEYKRIFDEWSEDLRTIPPGVVAEHAINNHEKSPHKRIIAHFMQPHAPYIGEKGSELSKQGDFGKFEGEVIRNRGLDIASNNIPDSISKGIITEEELKEIYIENLNLVLEEVESMINKLSGKTVLTSDHGEMLGERLFGRKRYGHGRYHTEELRRVPWFTIDSDSRRKIVEDKPEDFNTIDDRDERLKNLGYI